MLQRIIIILIIAGGALIFFGVREYMLVSGTKQEPLEIDLAFLENDRSIENNHIIIGPHIAIYSAAVFEYEYDEWGGDDEFSDTSPVNYAYYPIISETHPFFEQVAELESQYGSVDDIPDSLWPEINHFAVLVKTTEFTTVGDIPDTWKYEEAVQGIFINKIKSLDSEEKRLMQESFPSLDLDNLLILDKGREPGSLFLPYLMIGGGVVLILVCIGFIVGQTSGRKKTVTSGTEADQ